ncbi:MAG: TolC family protein, partial [Lamprocystis purpurea]|nr:TolC family protein [Lamprocystis purpurea]
MRTTWGALMTARSAMALATRRRDSAQALNNDVQKRFKVGELSRIDANLAQGEVLAAEAETIESRAALHQAEQAFRLLAGAAAPAELGDESVATQRGSPEAATAAAGHPQLAAVAALADNARALLKLAETTRRAAPELSLRLLRERGYFADSYDKSVGIKLKIPLSAGAQVRRETSLAQAEAEQAAAEMRRTEIRVQQEIERAHRAWEGAERLLTMAQERHRLSADHLRL